MQLLKNTTSSSNFTKLETPVQLIYSQQFMERPSPIDVNKIFNDLKSAEKTIKSLSTNTKQLELPQSNHLFPFSMPVETAREIKSFLDSVK